MRRLWTLPLLLALLLCGCRMSASTDATQTAEGTLTVHFIDVGQADCALLECGGEFLLIDGGNRDDSRLVVSYLEQQGVQELTAVVCTHAHEDHVGGLPGVLAVYPTAAVYAPTSTYASSVFDDFLYYTDQQGLSVTIPAPGDAIAFADARITVLGPVQSYADTNNTSLVLQVVYGETVFLFTGDMETTAENEMLDYWGDEVDWHADVLKVGHHGSSTSTGYRFLSQVCPEYGVISVGADNSYGHPHEEPLYRLRQAGVTVLRTDELGHILASSDGSTLTITWENQSAQPEAAQTAAEVTYIGNLRSKIFHSPYCSGLPAQQNRITFASYEAALTAGYSPCPGCLG